MTPKPERQLSVMIKADEGMCKEDFLELLKLHEFPKPVLVEQPAGGGLDLHTHDFEVMALVIEGSITIDCSGTQSLYAPGQVFHLLFQQPHSERYGMTGVTYLASRKMQSID